MRTRPPNLASSSTEVAPREGNMLAAFLGPSFEMVRHIATDKHSMLTGCDQTPPLERGGRCREHSSTSSLVWPVSSSARHRGSRGPSEQSTKPATPTGRTFSGGEGGLLPGSALPQGPPPTAAPEPSGSTNSACPENTGDTSHRSPSRATHRAAVRACRPLPGVHPLLSCLRLLLTLRAPC